MKTVGIAIKGAAGRMGQRIAAVIAETQGTQIAAALEHTASPHLGSDLSTLVSGVAPGIHIGADLLAALSACDVLIDFTTPESTLGDLERYANAGKPLVIGTTGFSTDQRAEIERKLANLAFVLSPNMSIGVNVLFNLVQQAAAALGAAYDVEILEAHHRYKKDAPSGTAVALAEAAATALGRKYPEAAVFSRRGLVGERTRTEIGMQVIRAGDIVGDHTVYFGGLGERLELTHRAHSRDTFARGAVRAALWVYDKPPGAYNMQDVLGLR